MRNLIIILLWVAVGYWYYSISRATCPEVTPTEANSGIIEEAIAQASSGSDSGTTTSYSFDKSSVNFLKDDSESISSFLPLREGIGLEIIGLAYADEEEPHQLALLRAKEIQTKARLSNSEVSLKGEVSEENYETSNEFVTFNSYTLSAEENQSSVDSIGFNGILSEGKKVLFYIDSYDSNSGLSDPVKAELRKAAYKLRNNFCRIDLVSYNDDVRAGKMLCFQFQEQLIRNGLNPSRIKYYTQKQGDRNMSIVELRIIE